MVTRPKPPPKFSPHVLQQLVILALCRFAEPIGLESVFPYLYYMVKSFGVPIEDIAYYSGITAAVFSFCQSFTGVLWGRVSDNIGRKPVIIIGLCGTFVSFLLFGFGKNLAMVIAARALCGLVNGNVGTLRTAVAELVPQKKLQPRAFTLMPIVWNIGAVIGPMIGGTLADPLRNHPEWFHGRRPAFFEKYPFALPNLVAALFFLISIPACVLFFDETLEHQKARKDPGRELGKKLVGCCRGERYRLKNAQDTETTPLLVDSPSADGPVAAEVQPKLAQGQPRLREVFTEQSTMNIIYYVLLALHSLTFDQLVPQLLAYPIQDPSDWRFPFKFSGGLGLQPPKIGAIASATGFVGIILQLFFFPPVAARFGSLKCLHTVSFFFPVIYFTLPFVLLIPDSIRMYAIYFLLFFKCIGAIFAVPCSTILLTNSAPSLRILGTLNGVAVSIAALGRATGPAIGGFLFSAGQRSGYLILPWALLGTISLITAFQCLLITGKGGIGEQDEPDNVDDDGTSSP